MASDEEEIKTMVDEPGHSSIQSRQSRQSHQHYPQHHKDRLNHTTYYDDKSPVKEGSGRLICPVGCTQYITSYMALVRHCIYDHGFREESIHERFMNRHEFIVWMEHLASVSGAFVRRRGERTHRDGTAFGDFYCVFDGKKRETPSNRAEGRAPYNRRQSSRKLGYACPAFVKYTVDQNGIVDVRAQLNHLGHALKPVDPDGPNPCRSSRTKGRPVPSPFPNERIRQGIRRLDDSFFAERDDVDLYEEEVGREGAASTTARSRGVNNGSTTAPHIDGDDHRGGGEEHGDEHVMNEPYDVDEHGMVNLLSISSLTRARFLASSSMTSAEMTLAEIGSVPEHALRRLPQLMAKLNEMAAASAQIEAILKVMASDDHTEEVEVEEEEMVVEEEHKVDMATNGKKDPPLKSLGSPTLKRLKVDEEVEMNEDFLDDGPSTSTLPHPPSSSTTMTSSRRPMIYHQTSRRMATRRLGRGGGVGVDRDRRDHPVSTANDDSLREDDVLNEDVNVVDDDDDQ